MGLQEETRIARMENSCEYAISIASLKKAGLTEEQIYEIIQHKDRLIGKVTTEDLYYSFSATLGNKLNHIYDSYDLIEYEVEKYINCSKEKLFKNIGWGNSFFDTINSELSYFSEDIILGRERDSRLTQYVDLMLMVDEVFCDS